MSNHYHAFEQALQAAAALMVSHAFCCVIVLYLDVSGKWKEYSMNKNREATWRNYWEGWKSFCVDIATLFLPFMTLCFWYSGKAISGVYACCGLHNAICFIRRQRAEIRKCLLR